MKLIVAGLLVASTLAMATSADAHHRHKVCFWRHHHQVCHWAW
jgi:hypothetical protein